jgi:hypothetical protein
VFADKKGLKGPDTMVKRGKKRRKERKRNGKGNMNIGIF